MKCWCGKRAVFIADKPLCREHFREWIEGKIRKELDRFVEKGDVLAVAASGGKDSTTLLKIAHDWAEERGIRIFAIMIDEGIEGYRNVTRAFLEDFCRKEGIELHVYSFREEFGKSLDGMIKIRDEKKLSLQACTICGTLRRYLLNKYARELGATKILFAHNMDDEVQTFLMNLFTGNLAQLSRKGEVVGIVRHPLFIPRLKPLIRIPERATAIYSLLFLKVPDVECPYLRESIRYRTRKLVFELESRMKGAKKRILDIYLEKILPELRKRAEEFHRPLKKCRICGEPSSGEICKACEIRNNLTPLIL